jgi:hypothetical protein
LVVVVKGQAKAAKELLELWLAGEINEVPLPDQVEREIASFLTEAYKS